MLIQLSGIYLCVMGDLTQTGYTDIFYIVSVWNVSDVWWLGLFSGGGEWGGFRWKSTSNKNGQSNILDWIEDPTNYASIGHNRGGFQWLSLQCQQYKSTFRVVLKILITIRIFLKEFQQMFIVQHKAFKRG